MFSNFEGRGISHRIEIDINELSALLKCHMCWSRDNYKWWVFNLINLSTRSYIYHYIEYSYFVKNYYYNAKLQENYGFPVLWPIHE